MHSARRLAASVLLLSGPTLAACARSSAVSRESLAGWEVARTCPRRSVVPTCASGRADADTARGGSLVVRLTGFGSAALLDHSSIVVAPLAPLDSVRQPIVRREDATDLPSPFEVALQPGRYLLGVRAFGYEGRSDTVAVRPGATDTVTSRSRSTTTRSATVHNCRPRGFRHAGERACVTDQITTVLVLDRVRDMASPRFRFGIGLPAGDSSDVHIVDDERVCERAARVYGLDTGPPRRVVVVDAVSFYVVYDPAEPVALGEYNEWLVIDRRLPRAGEAGAVTTRPAAHPARDRAHAPRARRLRVELAAHAARARQHQIDAASFTAHPARRRRGDARRARRSRSRGRGPRMSGAGLAGPLALFAYAAPFSFAYLRIGAAVGALVLFGVVQLTMIGYGIARGERPEPVMWLGLVLAAAGLALLTVPSVTRPDPLGVAAHGRRGRRMGGVHARRTRHPRPARGERAQLPLEHTARDALVVS